MNAPEARRQLTTAANPDAHSDYVVGIETETPPLPGLGGVRVALRYVPDKLILRPACLEGYLSALACPQWTSLEALALFTTSEQHFVIIHPQLALLLFLAVARYALLVKNRLHDLRVDHLLFHRNRRAFYFLARLIGRFLAGLFFARLLALDRELLSSGNLVDQLPHFRRLLFSQESLSMNTLPTIVARHGHDSCATEQAEKVEEVSFSAHEIDPILNHE